MGNNRLERGFQPNDIVDVSVHRAEPRPQGCKRRQPTLDEYVGSQPSDSVDEL